MEKRLLRCHAPFFPVPYKLVMNINVRNNYAHIPGLFRLGSIIE